MLPRVEAGAVMAALKAGWMRGAVAVGIAAMALAGSSVAPLHAQSAAATRVALVIGEGTYHAGPTPAAPDDAGLVAQVLAGAGFDVTGARDLDGDGLRRALRDFLDKAGTAGPDGIAVVYLAGRAIQSDGENFFLPVDARLARAGDVPIEALRLADVTRSLAALPIQARVVIVDGAYRGAAAGVESAPGLALTEAEQGELVALNAAPGTAAPPTAGPYGAYAQALAEALKQGGVPVGEVFARVRLAVNQATGGAVVPWESDRLTRSFTVFDRAPGAPAVASAQVPFAALAKRSLRDFPPDQAYDVALARDTLPAYAEFLAAFPADPLARRVRLILAVRREALVWRAVLGGDAPGAYWTYLARYPRGPHAADARRRLTRLAAAAAPPPRFVPLGFDVPPVGPDELAVDRVIALDAPDLPPPPPPPVFLLPPPVVVVLERPAPPPGPVFLPMPVAVALPYVRAPVEPGTIAPPRGVAGAYPRPRPFARGADGNGLVLQTSPPSPEARPHPSRPSVGRTPADGTPLPVPSVAPPTVPGPTAPAMPRPPSTPVAGSPPDMVRPVAPRLPTAPTPPATSSSSPGSRPASPAPVTANPATAAPVLPAVPTSKPTVGAAKPAVAHPAPATSVPAAPRTSVPPHGQPARPVPPVPSPPAVTPARRLDPPPDSPSARRPAPAPSADGAPRSAVPDRPPALPTAPARRPEPPPIAVPAFRPTTPGRPAPERPAQDRPAAAGPPPGDRRPACGHPGGPPCRP